MLKYQEIGEILSLIDSSSCDEVVLETDGIKLVVRRNGSGGATAAAPAASGAAPAAPPRPAPQAAAPSAQASGAAARDGAGVIGAPMVGTFYRAPSPDDPPFAELGARVAAGDPLGMIEVMKLFTTIHAEVAGTLREIGAENGQLVEFGQMLFVIDPD